jgi:hypothetical protein
MDSPQLKPYKFKSTHGENGVGETCVELDQAIVRRNPGLGAKLDRYCTVRSQNMIHVQNVSIELISKLVEGLKENKLENSVYLVDTIENSSELSREVYRFKTEDGFEFRIRKHLLNHPQYGKLRQQAEQESASPSKVVQIPFKGLVFELLVIDIMGCTVSVNQYGWKLLKIADHYKHEDLITKVIQTHLSAPSHITAYASATPLIHVYGKEKVRSASLIELSIKIALIQIHSLEKHPETLSNYLLTQLEKVGTHNFIRIVLPTNETLVLDILLKLFISKRISHLTMHELLRIWFKDVNLSTNIISLKSRQHQIMFCLFALLDTHLQKNTLGNRKINASPSSLFGVFRNVEFLYIQLKAKKNRKAPVNVHKNVLLLLLQEKDFIGFLKKRSSYQNIKDNEKKEIEEVFSHEFGKYLSTLSSEKALTFCNELDKLTLLEGTLDNVLTLMLKHLPSHSTLLAIQGFEKAKYSGCTLFNTEEWMLNYYLQSSQFEKAKQLISKKMNNFKMAHIFGQLLLVNEIQTAHRYYFEYKKHFTTLELAHVAEKTLEYVAKNTEDFNLITRVYKFFAKNDDLFVFTSTAYLHILMNKKMYKEAADFYLKRKKQFQIMEIHKFLINLLFNLKDEKIQTTLLEELKEASNDKNIINQNELITVFEQLIQSEDKDLIDKIVTIIVRFKILYLLALFKQKQYTTLSQELLKLYAHHKEAPYRENEIVFSDFLEELIYIKDCPLVDQVLIDNIKECIGLFMDDQTFVVSLIINKFYLKIGYPTKVLESRVLRLLHKEAQENGNYELIERVFKTGCFDINDLLNWLTPEEIKNFGIKFLEENNEKLTQILFDALSSAHCAHLVDPKFIIQKLLDNKSYYNALMRMKQLPSSKAEEVLGQVHFTTEVCFELLK